MELSLKPSWAALSSRKRSFWFTFLVTITASTTPPRLRFRQCASLLRELYGPNLREIVPTQLVVPKDFARRSGPVGQNVIGTEIGMKRRRISSLVNDTWGVATFRELGLDFPLFAAPVSEASPYFGQATCTLCRLPKPHCFSLGIGDDVILNCKACGTPNALKANDRKNSTCSQCGTSVQFPDTEKSVYSCSDCLRAGRAAITHNTELGMVRWEDAQRGITHGVPGDAHPDFPSSVNEDGWIQAHVPVSELMQLVHTPDFVSWQGEQWLFCHRQPMTYLGVWQQAEFQKAAPDGDGKTFFLNVLDESDEELWEYADSSQIGVYVFQCQECARLREYYDAS
ncbi:CbrC family protein [Deinococcus sp. UYEF24]